MQASMTRTEFVHHLEDIMNLDHGTISGTEDLASLGGWDSLAMTLFLAFVDRELGGNIAPAELEKCQTVDDLYQAALRSRS